MKIVDYNKKEKNYKKLSIVPIIAIFAFVVTLGITFFILSNEKKNDIPDDGLLVATSTEEVEVPPVSTPSPAVINEPQPDADPVNVSVEQVINYTSVDCDESSLKQLVIDTIQSANVQIEEARSDEEFTTVSVIMDAVDQARTNGALGDTFVPLGDELNPLPDDKQNWTYVDISGAIGGLLFYGKNPASSLFERSDMLKNFVSNGVYSFDVELLDDFTVSEAFDMIFVDCETGNYDVNFEISMIYRGQEWVALVGNINDGYRVLDVVRSEDLDNILVYNGVTTEPQQNVASTSEEPIEEVVNVPVQEEQGSYENENNNNNQVTNQVIFVDDPYVGMPNYTGPREGYYYDFIKQDYLPLHDGIYRNENLMGNLPSNEEFEAAGGQYVENCY